MKPEAVWILGVLIFFGMVISTTLIQILAGIQFLFQKLKGGELFSDISPPLFSEGRSCSHIVPGVQISLYSFPLAGFPLILSENNQ